MSESKVNPHCRIGKITRKGGGATVRVLRPNTITSVETREKFDGWAKSLSEQFENDMAGYVIVVWDRAGLSRTECAVADCSPYGRRLLPAFTEESVRLFLNERLVREILQNK